MNDVSDYDLFDYDYSTYWEERSYEHQAEKEILNKMLEEEEGDWFLDIGGSYGRISSTYYDKYKHPVILDYSAKTLEKNYEILKNKYPRLELIAANAYKIPFRDNVFDGGVMIRVLHHIENPKDYFKEARRVFGNNSVYIQEFANKMHIKAILRALLKRNFSFFTTERFEQPAISTTEGTGKGIKGLFFNYHLEEIKDILAKNKFKVIKKYGCSFLRSPLLKKIFNDSTLLFFERILRVLFSFTNFSPSIFLKTKLEKTHTEKNDYSNIQEVLVCPQCKSSLDFNQNEIASCNKCKREYIKKNNIWDFRVE